MSYEYYLKKIKKRLKIYNLINEYFNKLPLKKIIQKKLLAQFIIC